MYKYVYTTATKEKETYDLLVVAIEGLYTSCACLWFDTLMNFCNLTR